MIDLEPRLGGPVLGEEIPPVDYLDWYVPRLNENRPHDLSQSGYAHPWDFEDLLLKIDASQLGGFWGSGNDPREWVAQRYGVEVDNVLIAHGACQAMVLAIAAAIPQSGPRAVAVEMPSFAPLSQCARLLGCEVIPFFRGPEDPNDSGPWKLNRGSLMEILPKVSAITITPCQNPSGWMLLEDDLNWLLEKCEEHTVNIVSDEVYLDSSMGTEFYRPMFKGSENVISVNSLTKCYGLGSIRFGWAIGSREKISHVRNAFQNMQGLSAAPSAAIAGAAWPLLDEVLDNLRANRERNLPLLMDVLRINGIHFNPPPTGIFGIVPIGTDSVRALAEHGKPLGLLATPGSMFDSSLKNSLRIAWGSEPESFAAAMPVLSEFLTRLQEE